MFSKKLLCTGVVAALASLGLSAHAQDRDYDHRDHYDRDGRYGQYDRDGRAMEQQRNYDRDDRRGYDSRAMGGPGRHHWRRGERLPDEYRHGGYVDWRAYNLQPPPAGYQWVNVDGDLVLVALASGLIADLIVNSR
jgi:Ni/Co efflux regulator RcnB